MNSDTYYAEKPGDRAFTVTFLNAAGQRLSRGFDSPYLADRFTRRVMHSKTCTLVSCVQNY